MSEEITHVWCKGEKESQWRTLAELREALAGGGESERPMTSLDFGVTVDEFNKLLEMQKAALATRDSEIAGLKKCLASAESEIAAKDREIAELKDKLEGDDDPGWRERWDATISEKSKEIAELKKTITEAEIGTKRRDAEIERLRGVIDNCCKRGLASGGDMAAELRTLQMTLTTSRYVAPASANPPDTGADLEGKRFLWRRWFANQQLMWLGGRLHTCYLAGDGLWCAKDDDMGQTVEGMRAAIESGELVEVKEQTVAVDVIGGFPVTNPYCSGCCNKLLVENAWMTDGCPCNSTLGINSMNETRWRLLMSLQQRQSHELEKLKSAAKLPSDDLWDKIGTSKDLPVSNIHDNLPSDEELAKAMSTAYHGIGSVGPPGKRWRRAAAKARELLTPRSVDWKKGICILEKYFGDIRAGDIAACWNELAQLLTPAAPAKEKP